jgi:cytochrome c biogenesis protein CcmG/thiol:disulfide interchange protein DsbE
LEYRRTFATAYVCVGALLSAFTTSVSAFADAGPEHSVATPAPMTARTAPDFSLPAITDRNETITLTAFRGKTVYLDFWSSWCAPCRESLPLLNELHEQLGGNDFEIVAVNLDQHPADGRRLMEQFAIAYPVASDIIGVTAEKYGAQTLPASYLISGDGILQRELPQLDRRNIATIKASVLELIEQDRGDYR